MKTLILSLPFILFLGACSFLVDFEEEKTSQERNCHDTLDNDDDGRTDCEDQDCEDSEDCTGPNINNFNNINNINNVVNPEVCDNGFDDDRDDLLDCEDDDCFTDPFCNAQPEDCFNGEDDDGDDLVDCDDPDCRSLEACSAEDESDCGDLVDDDGDGLVDCEDDDCLMNPICDLHLELCNEIIDYYNNLTTLFYYADIYMTGQSENCTSSYTCTILPEYSWVPRCYPTENTTVIPAYQPCSADSGPCGPGLVCLWSDKISNDLGSEVCLPLCAPGRVDQCVGNQGLCFRHWTDTYDNFHQMSVELWLCEIPSCNPMEVNLSGCTISTSRCYPTPDLMGDATCHASFGTTAVGGLCFNNDEACIPGTICRKGPNDGTETRCHTLCTDDTQCTYPSTCYKLDNRQYFGFCK